MSSPLQDRNSQRVATQRALLAVPDPPMFLERHDPPSDAPNVITVNDGPMPSGYRMTRRAQDHYEYLDGLMENALDGIPLPPHALERIPFLADDATADPSRQYHPRQYHPAAPAEAPVSDPAPIPVSVAPEPVTPTVEDEELRPCSTCHRRCPPTDFVGVTGQRTRTTCNACCVCLP
jgi:hypothetical protein